jgi:hypothetical protein
LAATENVEERERDGEGGVGGDWYAKERGRRNAYIGEPETGPWRLQWSIRQ